jgi:hypothetical protein
LNGQEEEKMEMNKIRLMSAVMLLSLAVTMYSGFSGIAAYKTYATETAPAVPLGKPEAMIDLATDEGAKLVNGQWRYSDTKIVETDFRGPGLDKQPTGKPIKAYDYEPKAGVAAN